VEHGFDVFGARRRRLDARLARELHDPLVACRVRVDAGMVERHRQRGNGVPDRAALLPSGAQCRHGVGDVLRCHGIDALGRQRCRQKPNARAVLKLRVLAHVHAAGLPTLRGLGDRQGGLGRGQLAEVRQAPRREFIADLPLADLGFTHRAERAAVEDAAGAADEAILDAVARLPRLRRPLVNPARRHRLSRLENPVAVVGAAVEQSGVVGRPDQRPAIARQDDVRACPEHGVNCAPLEAEVAQMRSRQERSGRLATMLVDAHGGRSAQRRRTGMLTMPGYQARAASAVRLEQDGGKC
jgi:hypothetical protein